jgi:hypothetical protein
MTYVVDERCIKCKTTDCVAVCPVNCFYEGENMLVIHPDECSLRGVRCDSGRSRFQFMVRVLTEGHEVLTREPASVLIGSRWLLRGAG